VIEGLACGRPAIVSPTCGIADLIASHGAGLTPRHDPRAVAEAVRTIARDRARFGQSARELATREFSLATFTSAYRDLYERLYSEKYAA
jgi:glycosyltransferase involved in cell wall biosynthesis